MSFVGGELCDGVPAFPESWYHLAMSSELPPGGVLTRRVCGREVVAFRTVTGSLGVLDAHCPHLGAHLGHGGRVVGEALRCLEEAPTRASSQGGLTPESNLRPDPTLGRTV